MFSSKEEAIAFAEDYGFDDAHVELLHTAGMIFESAEALINSGRIADAVKALIFSPRAQDRTRRAVEYLTTGLWQYQSFGVDNPTMDTEAVSELLELAKTLRDDMHEQEVNEVGSLFPCGIALIHETHRSRCSEQGTKAILKLFIFSIPGSPKQKITLPLCYALIPHSSPPSLSKTPPQSITDPNFSSISPTSSS